MAAFEKSTLPFLLTMKTVRQGGPLRTLNTAAMLWQVADALPHTCHIFGGKLVHAQARFRRFSSF